ncbi:uncharacterized protein NPIL_98191 [Nephila pilipes]|uniref:Uncharacterized protein n=1 Tax=Nephila pilipes TaxID=299642 RepID=A0A8X6UAA5_NEPPI|nr:uncharacterized protein NPIL_98191 [Nephila pilipes]
MGLESCGRPGIKKTKCPTCNPISSRRIDVETNHVKAYATETRSPRLTLIDVTFYGLKGYVYVDTGSLHSIAGEKMYQVFNVKGLIFQETTLVLNLANVQQTTGEALIT